MTWVGVSNSGELLHSTNDESLIEYGGLRGDVSGTINQTQVVGIGGFSLPGAAPTSNQIIKFNGSEWTYAADAGGSANTLLDGSVHSDTVANTPFQGDIILGDNLFQWTKLARGAAGTVLHSNGSNISYTLLGQATPHSLGTAGAPSVTFTGDLDTGLSAAAANTLVASASGTAIVTVENANDGELVTLDGGQVVRTRVVAGGAQAMTNDDYIMLVTAGGGTVSLPGGPRSGQVVMIKDRDGSASPSPANRITIDGNGVNVDGNSSIRITRSYGSFTLLYNGTEWNVI